MLSIISAFVIARIVGPAELGIGTAVTLLHVILWVGVNSLFADALVQRETVDDALASGAFWTSCGVGCFAMVLQSLAGCLLVMMIDDTRLMPMALVLAVPLPMVGAAGVLQGLLTRARDYRHLALRTLVGQGLGTTVGVLAAGFGAGAWAIVAQQTVTSFFGALALLLGNGWRPVRRVDWSAVFALLAVGVPLTASTLVSIGRYRIFALLIGGTAGAAVLGQVHIAFRLVDTLRDLTFTALWRLMLPVLSKHQNDRQAMLLQVDHWLRYCAALMLPVCLGLGCGLSPFVSAIMGRDWGVVGQAALPLVALFGWSLLTFPAGVAAVALGHSRIALYANIASLLCIATGVLLLRPTNPLQAVMIWTIGQLMVSPFALWANARALRVGLFRPLTGGLQALQGR